MSGSYSIDETLKEAENYITRLGDSVGGTFEGQADSEPLKGLSCEHGRHNYLVMASSGWEWIQLRYPLNFDQLYAVRRLGTGTEEDEFQITSSDVQQARRELDNRLNDMPQEERREFRLNLIQMLSREEVILDLDTTSPLNIHGFNIDSKLFIRDPHFSIADFHRGVQTIINLGWVGQEFVLENYGFRPPEVGGGVSIGGP